MSLLFDAVGEADGDFKDLNVSGIRQYAMRPVPVIQVLQCGADQLTSGPLKRTDSRLLGVRVLSAHGVDTTSLLLERSSLAR